MTQEMLNKDSLRINCQEEIENICSKTRFLLSKKLRRRGIVVAVSGGIDSSATLALAVKSVGAQRVLALLMPEKHSADETLMLGNLVADRYGVEKIYKNISSILEAVGFYEKYNDAVKQVIPKYNDDWKSKIVTPNIIESKTFNFFSIIAEAPDGEIIKKRIPLKAYLEIVAATNFKQRIRKMLEYYHADRLNYAVAGTPNRLEYDQGFFVKLGDGAADIKPIAHLYKTQVYQIAEHLGVPKDIINRAPTTDTYSLAQGQDEFYFSLPYDKMDLCLYGKNNNIPIAIVANSLGLEIRQVERVYDDIDMKRNTTSYLHLKSLLIEDINEINI